MFPVSCQFINADQSSVECADQFKTHFKITRPSIFVRRGDYIVLFQSQMQKQGNTCWFIPADHDF